VGNLNKLVELYKSDARAQQIMEAVQEGSNGRVQVLGQCGAQDAFMVCGVFLAEPRTQLIVALDRDEAQHLQSNISNLLEKKKIRFFPDSFRKPMQFETLNPEYVSMRAETVNSIASKLTTGEIVVTYPEALFEKVVMPAALSKHRIVVSVGETLNIDFMIEVLVEYGFVRSDFVYSPGNFSIRGGIIDIFSYGNELPYRIELFDEEVESIRTFEPTSQLSTQKIAKISIIPNLNTRFQQEEKTSLFNVLPEDTLIWIKDYQILEDKLLGCFERAEDFAKSISALDTSDLAEIFRDRAFVYPNDVIADVASFPIVVMSKSPNPFTIQKVVKYNSKPQPSFNKNFGLLIENLHENHNNLLENYIFTDNETQIERFYTIFNDLKAEVQFHPIATDLHQGFIDHDLNVACYTDHQIFERFHRSKLAASYSGDAAMSIRGLKALQQGDFVSHIDHGIGVFSGLEKITINGHVQESVRLIYRDKDILYVGINSLHKISKYVGKEGTDPKLAKLGSDTWKNLKHKTKKQIKDIAEELIKIYALRKGSTGHAFMPDGYLQNELEASFIYEDTPDQLRATIDVKADMEKPHPMDRLVCGDVGFGKTEVAMRAAFKAVCDGKQVAILVPTTILALQHNKTFHARLKDFGVTVDYVNRFRTTKEKKEIAERLKAGKIDLLIGTQSILSKDMEFKDLGLLIVDEEQKFGVSAKEKLRGMKVNVDTLTLTATPIPRTLHFSLMAARDMSIIRTPPPNRQPIQTETRVFNEELIKDAIELETSRGGQVFFVHNRVQSLQDMVDMLRVLCPGISIEMAHGQMEPEMLEKRLVGFIEQQYDVLVCTNIIETGLDIPNANTIIINNAHQFGLSDLHQLRGRVGRSNRKAFCYLFSPPLSVLTNEARKRLQTLEEFSDLGSGFDIAMKDLDIRGAGNLLGAEQSGFINEIGFQMYQKILEEAIMELKESNFKELFKDEMPNPEERRFVRDVEVETDVEMLIPTEYIEHTQERLNIYTDLNRLETEEEINAFAIKLADRFGRIPDQIKELFDGIRLRWICKKMGFERISLKDNKLRCYFVLNPQSPYYETPKFKNILKFVGGKGTKEHQMSLKQTPKSLIVVRDNVRTLKGARKILELIEGGI
jgi:transcription-repair coupling factor (superfamily II helicase)